MQSQSLGSVENAGRPEIRERPSNSANPDFRPLLRFLRRPAFGTSIQNRLPVWYWLGWIGLLLLVEFLGGVFDRILVGTFNWPVPAVSPWHYFFTHPSWAAFAILLVAPALEELGFRAFLSVAPKFVFIGLTFFPVYVYWFIQAFAPAPTLLRSSWFALTYLFQYWPALPAGAISLLLYRYRREAVLAFFRQRAAWVFWASCILFGAGHYRLYTDHLAWWGFALVAPQFLSGIGFAYLRVRFGLRWSMATHYAIDVLLALSWWSHNWASSSLDFSSASPNGLLDGMVLTFAALRFVLMTCGFIVLWFVLRLRW
jgi:hypothetical protein